MDIYKNLRNNLQVYYTDVLMSGGYKHNLPFTLKKIEAYYNSKFLTGDRDKQNQKKYFDNIVIAPCDVGEKFVEIDAKNIVFVPEVGGIRNRVMIMGRQFKTWVKESYFSVLLNTIGHNYPKVGHVVIKKGKDNVWKNVHIQNLRMDPSIESLEGNDFVYELISMTKREINEMGWNGTEGIDQINQTDQKQFLIYICHVLNTEVKGKKWKRVISTGMFRLRKGDGIIETNESQFVKGKGEDFMTGITLHQDEMDELPYKELKWKNVAGRWLGMGTIELLFDDQQRINEIGYLKAKSLYLKALQIFQTRDESYGKNLITSAEFGKILHGSAEITQVKRDNVDLSAYSQEESRIDRGISRKTHSTDIAMGGDDLPSQTPLGLGRLQTALTISFFRKKKQNFALFIKEIMYDDILPEFKKANRKAHEVVVGRTAEEFESLLVAEREEFIDRYLINQKTVKGIVPTWERVVQKADEFVNDVRTRGELKFDIEDKFYDNLKAVMDIVIVGELTDIKAKQEIYKFAMTSIQNNPQLLVSPLTRNLFFKLMENTGESMAELSNIRETTEALATQEQGVPVAGQGGGGKVDSKAITSKVDDKLPNIQV